MLTRQSTQSCEIPERIADLFFYPIPIFGIAVAFSLRLLQLCENAPDLAGEPYSQQAQVLRRVFESIGSTRLKRIVVEPRHAGTASVWVASRSCATSAVSALLPRPCCSQA